VIALPCVMINAIGPKNGDYVVVRGRDFRLGPSRFTVVRWPSMIPAHDGPDLPRTLAEAYATDLATQAGTEGWTLFGGCLEGIESLRDK
jgi:hypothetical protein